MWKIKFLLEVKSGVVSCVSDKSIITGDRKMKRDADIERHPFRERFGEWLLESEENS